MKNRKGQKFFLCLSLFLLIIALAHIFLPQLNNWKLLAAGNKSIYLELKELDGTELEMELQNTEGYSPYSSTLVYNPVNLIVPDKDIYYYAHPGDVEPAFVMKTGEKYWYCAYPGYAFISWPTYDREWRYAKPLLHVGEGGLTALNEGMIGELPFYYVRYSDLKGITDEKIAKWDSFSPIEDEDLHRDVSRDLSYYDHWLRELGLYYSPNLPIFLDIWNISFLAAGLLLLSMTLFWMHKSRKKDAGSQELINNSDKAISA